MLIKELIEKFENIIPKDLQDSWDNSGLQVGNTNQEIKKIYLCLDVTDDVIEHAISRGCNLIISHHPILFKSKKSLDYDDFISKKIIDAIKNDLVIYSSHTAIDVNTKGLNNYVFEKMGFVSQGKVEYTFEEHGYGDYAVIEETSLNNLAKNIKDKLGLNHIIVYGNLDKKVSKVALVTGAGASFLDDIKKLGVDLFITADVKHHDAMDALEQGINIFDLGHYQSEKLFNDLVKEILLSIDNFEIILEKNLEKYNRIVF